MGEAVSGHGLLAKPQATGSTGSRSITTLPFACYACSMTFFARAVVTGFALSLGSALFKKVQGHLGLGDDKDKAKNDADKVNKQDAATDPGLVTAS
jgi:hypothetical protein